MCVRVCERMCVYMCVCACVYVHHVNVCACVQVHVHACVCSAYVCALYV